MCHFAFVRLYIEKKIGYLLNHYAEARDGFGSVDHLFVPKEFNEGLSEHSRLPTHC